MFSEVMEGNQDSWEEVIVSRESWLDVRIPCDSCGDVTQLPRPIEMREFFIWTQNFVYFLECDDVYCYATCTFRTPEAFRASLKSK